jgi:hypothetical protein
MSATGILSLPFNRERNPYPKHQALPSATEEALDVGF